MSTRSSARNLFPPLDNLELIIRRRSRTDPTLLNDFEMATEENGDLPVPDLRTMKELCQPSLNGRGGLITPIAIQAMNFGLKNDMIQQVHNSCQYHGLPGDDANKHLDKFLHVTQSIKVNGVTDDALHLYLFPHSLTHHAAAWFDRLPRNSINTFEQMAKMFLVKYFPPSMVTKLRNEITNFRQRGTFMKMCLEECYDLIENMTAHHNDWDTSAQRSDSSSSITSSFDTEIAALNAEMAEINKNLMRVLQVDQQVKAITPNCKTCGGPYSFKDCPAIVGQTQNVYAAGAYQGNSYQPQGNRNLLSYRSDNYLGQPGNNQERNQFFQGASHGQNPPPAYQAPVYQAPIHQPQIPQPQVVTTNEFTNYMKANDSILKIMQINMTYLTNSNLELKNMFGQFMKMNTASSLDSRTLPGNTITNPKEDLKGITTRSGTFLENKPNVAGSGPTWLFEIDNLTKTMNYQPVTAGNQSNPSAGVQEQFHAEKAGEKIEQQYVLFPVWSSGSTNTHNTDGDAPFDEKEPEFDEKKPEYEFNVSPSSSAQSKKQNDKTKREAKGKNPVKSFTGYRNLSAKFEDFSNNSINKDNAVDASQLLDDPDMPELEDITYSDDEDDVSAEADFNDLETSIIVSPIPTTRVHKDHHVTQIIGDLSPATQTWSMTRVARDQGHTQEEGIDYEEVFAPVAKIEAIRLFLAYASFMGFMVYQMDVKSAFLYKTIEEEVYACQPLGFEDPDHPDKVYKVVKAIYGLHQALRAWYETLANYLLENGFQRGKIDQTLFIKRQKCDILLVQIYVNDIIFVKQKKDGIFISQDKYVAEILRKFRLTDRKSASTPIDTEKPLLKDPDVKRIFRYLKGKPHLGLWYPKDSPFDLVAYLDNDYAGASLDRKSTTGGCQFLGCRLIFWQCKKQTVVATSSTEAEYVAATSCCSKWYGVFEKDVTCYKYLKCWFTHLTTNGSQFTMSNPHQELASPDETVSGKDSSNPLMADNLPKIVWANDNCAVSTNLDITSKFHDSPLLGVNTPRSDEDRLELIELTVFLLPSDEKVRVKVSAVDLQVSAVRLILLLLVQKFLLFGLTNWCYSLCAVSSIKYGLTVNPNIYVSCIKQFWTTVAVKNVNDVTRLQALVDKKKVVVTEATIRDALRLDDAEGVECLPNEEMFAELASMGYEKPSTKITFYKAFFSSHLVRNVDSPTKFYMYPRFLQLMIRKQVGDLSTHTTKYTSPTLTQKVFANMRRVGKGFSRVKTLLFEGMLVAQKVGEGAADEVNDEGVHAASVATEGVVSATDDVVPTADEEPSIPSPTPPTPPPQPSHDILSTSQVQSTPLQSPQVQAKSPQHQPQHQPQSQPLQDAGLPMDLLQNLMDTCTALTRKVKHLELDKIAQALKITKLKRMVKKLKKRNKVKVLKLRRLQKVETVQRIDTSDDTVMDDVSNQERMIADMDADADVVLEEANDVAADAKANQDADED
nr:hypothetical protein [Tanacetum cinerariifolium]